MNMTRARILYDCLKRDGVENDLSDMIRSYCPKHFGLSEFAECRFKTVHLVDPYECLQCWMGEERKEEVKMTQINRNSEECESAEVTCEFCTSHAKGDTLYEMSSWDNGVGFDYIRNIKYCPICGRELQE